nr:UDP-N-acetylmuramoyl-tripeptide--D-alanyl-D-alanine ligase [Conchiformibius kuhniae]
MKNLTLSFITQTLGIPAPAADAPIYHITTDSRQARAGDLFVALVGEKHDAHDFVPDVLAKGAFALVSRPDCAALAGCLKTDDTLHALQTLAAAWRQRIKPFVFGITGSSGKTTVKEMLATILRHTFGADAVLATAGNFNNHIGLPLTLLNLRENHRYAVIEMGMNHAGELAQLTRIARPDAALVNNAMRAHIGCGFDGVDDIARAKSEIYQGLSGTAVLPAEDARLPLFQAAASAFAQISFGAEAGDVHAENLRLLANGSEFDLACGAERAAVRLPAPGLHNVRNAAAAAALARCAGVSLAQCAAGLQHFATIGGRLQFKNGIRGASVIDDSYNANPDSMKAAVDVLAAQPAPRVLVMGDMGELGEAEAAAMHAEVGAYARSQGIEAAYFLGHHSAAAAEAFGAAGLWFADADPLIQVLTHDLPNGASVLVKGSRFMKMERIAGALADVQAA